MVQPPSPARLAAEIRALVRLHHATDGTAIGLASISMDGLDQSWRDRIQRIRALPREAPRRSQMIQALRQLIEQSMAERKAAIETLGSTDASLAEQALLLADRARQAPPNATTQSEQA